MIPPEKWKEEVEMNRKLKDSFLAESWQSPIPPNERGKFNRLNYYPVNPKFYFELEIHEHEKKEMIQIQDTKENMRNLIRWGEFTFEIEGKDYKLQAYKSDPSETRFFVPFRDETSGKETYGAGKYLDLEEENHKISKGKWILDFNVA
ncbi:MAG: DUF1684 domain-containing protein, partial [Promethearchaeota archaeon]